MNWGTVLVGCGRGKGSGGGEVQAYIWVPDMSVRVEGSSINQAATTILRLESLRTFMVKYQSLFFYMEGGR